MGLTATQKSIINKAQSVGGSKQGVALDDEQCAYLAAVVATDLRVRGKLRLGKVELPPFFGTQSLDSLRLPSVDFLRLFEQLVKLDQDADAYFDCLASLHKARLKYERILQTQPVPTIDQVGPRGLLQYGCIATKALTPFLLWRKWLYDIDNRAAQETGYAFEPIVARAIGGTPAPAKKSPVRRQSDPRKGRQVDCILGKKAHEIKMRVTIAASGQGRWKEELDFPSDCKSSGYTPVLVVLDPTPNPKLTELQAKFLSEDGEAHIGEGAWAYLRSLAGPTMSRFLDLYVHTPLQAVLAEATAASEQLPALLLKMEREQFTASILGESLIVRRTPQPEGALESEAMPEDADEEVTGL
ncbi:MAG TPA: hypothetical protein VH575_25310 [Gemmataceae bacterium]